jgi:hypothetical protein
MEKIKAVVCLVGFFCDSLFAIIKTLGCIINGSSVAPKLNGGIAMKGTIHFTRVLHTQPLRYEKIKNAAEGPDATFLPGANSSRCSGGGGAVK